MFIEAFDLPSQLSQVFKDNWIDKTNLKDFAFLPSLFSIYSYTVVVTHQLKLNLEGNKNQSVCTGVEVQFLLQYTSGEN